MLLYDEYLKAKQAVKEAEEWNALPDGPKYMSDTMQISIAHCTAPTLQRMGQQSCGGTNYWKSPKDLNGAILRVIINRQDAIIGEAINILKVQEADALIACQAFIDKLQNDIDEQIKNK